MGFTRAALEIIGYYLNKYLISQSGSYISSALEYASKALERKSDEYYPYILRDYETIPIYLKDCTSCYSM